MIIVKTRERGEDDGDDDAVRDGKPQEWRPIGVEKYAKKYMLYINEM